MNNFIRIYLILLTGFFCFSESLVGSSANNNSPNEFNNSPRALTESSEFITCPPEITITLPVGGTASLTVAALGLQITATIVMEDGINQDNTVETTGTYPYMLLDDDCQTVICSGIVTVVSNDCMPGMLEAISCPGHIYVFKTNECNGVLTLSDLNIQTSGTISIDDGVGSDNVIQNEGTFVYVVTDDNCNSNTCSGLVTAINIDCNGDQPDDCNNLPEPLLNFAPDITLDLGMDCETVLTSEILGFPFAEIVVIDGVGMDATIQGTGTFQYNLLDFMCPDNTASGFVTVTSFTCPSEPLEIYLSADCEATLTMDLIDPTFCGSATIVVEDGVGADNRIQGCGTYLYRVTDNNCPDYFCTGFITAIDNIPPEVAVVPPDLTGIGGIPFDCNDINTLYIEEPFTYLLDQFGVLIDGSFSSQQAEEITAITGYATFTDNCGIIIVKAFDNIVSGGTPANPVNIIQRTFQAKDACSELPTQEFTQQIIISDCNISLILGSEYLPGADYIVNPGDSVKYTYKVENTGNSELNNISLSEYMGSFTGTGLPPVPEYVVGSSSMGSLEGILLPGEMALYEGIYEITSDDIMTGFIDYQAIASGLSVAGALADDISDSSNLNDINETGEPGQANESDPTNTVLEVIFIPTLGQWGIIVLGLLLMIIGVISQRSFIKHEIL